MMVCSYCFSCLDLPVELVDCQVEGCSSCLHHVCQGRYGVLNHIDFDGAERKIYHNCVDKLQVGGKSYTFKKVGDINV